MLLAHWMYFLAGMLELAVDSTKQQGESLSGITGKDGIIGMNIGHDTDDEETSVHDVDCDGCDGLSLEVRTPRKRRSSVLSIFFSKELDV